MLTNIDNGLQNRGDGVDNGHDAATDRGEHTLDLCRSASVICLTQQGTAVVRDIRRKLRHPL